MGRRAGWYRNLLVGLVLLVPAAACGGAGTSDPRVADPPAEVPPVPPPATADSPTAAAPEGPVGVGSGILPDVNLIDVATGAEVNLARMVPSEKPTLYWFWAPH